MKPADREWPYARLIFLGGEPVLLAHVEHHQRFNKEAQRTLMGDLARMAHPKAVALTTPAAVDVSRSARRAGTT